MSLLSGVHLSLLGIQCRTLITNCESCVYLSYNRIVIRCMLIRTNTILWILFLFHIILIVDYGLKYFKPSNSWRVCLHGIANQITQNLYMLYYTWGSNTHREQANSPSDELYGIDQVQLSCMVNRWQHNMFGCTG